MKFLGIDIGGTNTKIGIVDEVGNLTEFRKMSTNAFGADPTPYLARLEALIGP